MSKPEHLPTLSRVELLALVADRQRPIDAWRAEIDELKRGGKRQAAPFSNGSRVAAPKPPGRQPGPGTFRYRGAPTPADITEPPMDVKVTQDACPAWGGALEEQRVELTYTPAIPEPPRPRVTQYRGWSCRCTVCGCQVRGRHPDLAPAPHGATAHRLGPRVMAAAQALHAGVGMPVRQVPAGLATLTGGPRTPGALTHEALRRAAGPVGPVSEPRRATVPGAPVVYPADTGGRVGGTPASLLAVETAAATLEPGRSRQRHEAVQEVIPADEVGVRVPERGRRDEAQACEGGRPHHCLAHRPRSRRQVLATKTGRARDVAARRKGLLPEALPLWPAARPGPLPALRTKAQAVQAALTDQRRDRRRQAPAHQRLRNALGWHHDRGNLVRFLDDLRSAPPNKRAERALRPAVIARKVSPCSKTDDGAHALAAFTSVGRTLAKQSATSLVEGLYPLSRSPNPQAFSP